MLGIFLDSEANGLNPHKHKLIEIAFKILDVKTGKLKETFQSIVKIPLEEWKKSDPSSLKVNGFTWEEILQGKDAATLAQEIMALFKKWNIQRGSALFICQNPSFDRAFFSQIIDPDIQEKLGWPYHWLDLASMYWAETIKKGSDGQVAYPWETGVSKDRISEVYKLPPEEKPHRALNGVNHLLLCYQSIVGFPCK